MTNTKDKEAQTHFMQFDFEDSVEEMSDWHIVTDNHRMKNVYMFSGEKVEFHVKYSGSEVVESYAVYSNGHIKQGRVSCAY